jgi:WD40-like Beta Propeller Repeat
MTCANHILRRSPCTRLETDTGTPNLTALSAAGGATIASALLNWRTTASFTIGTYSPVFFFALLGAATLSFSEVGVASALAGIVQSTFRPKRRPIFGQVCCSAANAALSSCAGLLVIEPGIPGLTEQPLLDSLILSVVYFLNTALVSVVLTEVGASNAPTRLISSTRMDTNPQYSPDGSRIAFTSSRTGPLAIWVSDSDGANPAQLTDQKDLNAGGCSAYGGAGYADRSFGRSAEPGAASPVLVPRRRTSTRMTGRGRHASNRASTPAFSMLVDRKVSRGWRSVWRKSGLRRWTSRCSSRVWMDAVSISMPISDCVISASFSFRSPRTLEIIMWRTLK